MGDEATAGVLARVEALLRAREPARVALTLEEAAASIGLSARAFRDHLFRRCPKFYAGTSPRIPADLFKRFIEELAHAEHESSVESARGLLDRTDRRHRA